MPDYTLFLKKEKQQQYHRISLFIFFLNTLFMLYLCFYGGAKQVRVISIAILSLLGLFTIINFYFRKTRYQYGYHVYFFAFYFSWILIEMYWMAGVMLVFQLLHQIATRELKILLSAESVQLPVVFNKNKTWSEFNNIVLKDGLLTIDFKNNSIIQHLVDPKSELVNEEEFNDFCRQQLNK